MNFLNNNRAEHENDLKIMDTVLNDDSSPAQIESAIKKLGESGDIRLRELGGKYSNTMGDEYPNLYSRLRVSRRCREWVFRVQQLRVQKTDLSHRTRK